MNILAPVSSIMSTDLVTLLSNEPLAKAKELFEKDNIHHIPVVGFKEIIGILSKSDLLHFMRGSIRGKGDQILEETRLNAWKVDEIMQKDVLTLQKTDTIINALDIFKNNRIHCIPILDGTTLVGIVTPHDVIMKVREEGMKLID
jgi:acetoin utilization protein AcuB